MSSPNNFVILLHKLKTIYEEGRTADTEVIAEQCEGFNDLIITNEYYEYKDLKGACIRVMYYITKLKENYLHHLASGCKYLYQWVTKEYLNKTNYNEYNLKFYKKLLRESCEYQGLDEEYENQIVQISDEIFQKYKFLDDLYTNLNKLHKTSHDKCAEAETIFDLYNLQINECLSNVNKEFCNELELFRYDYESVMKNKSCQNVQKTLPSVYGNNTITTIIIPFSIISLLTLSLFIMYKVKK